MKPSLPAAFALTLIPAFTACGGGGGEPAETEVSSESLDKAELTPENARETIRKRVRDAQEAVLEAQAAGPVPVPSHRRLLGFLPAELPGRSHAYLESESNPNSGQSTAEGRYLVGQADFRRQVELEIAYYGKAAYNPTKYQFHPRAGEPTKIAGFEAIIEREDDSSGANNDIYVRLDGTLMVHASGSARVEDLESALAAIDLKELKRQLDDETLFEPNEVDLLAESILGASDLADLLPSALGTSTIANVQQQRSVEREPFFARASATYGSAQFVLFDYGTAAGTEAISRGAADLGSLAYMTKQKNFEVTEGTTELENGAAYWAMGTQGNGHAVLSMRMFQGRFVAEYTGQFLPAPETEMTEQMKAAMQEMIDQLGMGAYESPDAQLAAVRAAFEATDLESVATEVAR